MPILRLAGKASIRCRPVNSALGAIDKTRMRSLALFAIHLYQRFISPYKGFCCAYRVHTGRRSCSNLGYRAISCFGLPAGLQVLRRRLYLCGVAQRRFAGSTMHAKWAQRGSLDCACDIPCDANCNPDIGCGEKTQGMSWCCDACSCDGPSKKKKAPEEKYAYLPPNSGKL